jgi:hypothetical protein
MQLPNNAQHPVLWAMQKLKSSGVSISKNLEQQMMKSWTEYVENLSNNSNDDDSTDDIMNESQNNNSDDDDCDGLQYTEV